MLTMLAGRISWPCCLPGYADYDIWLGASSGYAGHVGCLPILSMLAGWLSMLHLLAGCLAMMAMLFVWLAMLVMMDVRLATLAKLDGCQF
jgi:hypothetical protein